jgi:diguanylate cyclase (GGDEF)-like protein
MNTLDFEANELHWLMDMLQTMDVGLLVIDRDYRVQLWNSFMQNHSGRSATTVMGEPLFRVFPDIEEDWLRRKADSVFQLACPAFTNWEQRPYLFHFKNYRPITGTADFMYQNVTLIPLTSANGTIQHVGVIVHDVTDIAVNRTDLEILNAQLAAVSRTDHLTALNNRGYWEERLTEEFRRFKRSPSTACTLIMFDIDHFKRVNDTYGHQAGDEVIRTTAQILRDNVRNTDVTGRYGGEEFGVVLVDTASGSAMVLAERLRTRIEALTVGFDEHEIRFTISLGIAQVSDATESYGHWIECADQALYEAKRSGRNRSVIYTG